MTISHHQCYYPPSLNYLSDNFLSWSFTYDSKTVLCLICLRFVVNIAERVINKCKFFKLYLSSKISHHTQNERQNSWTGIEIQFTIYVLKLRFGFHSVAHKEQEFLLQALFTCFSLIEANKQYISGGWNPRARSLLNGLCIRTLLSPYWSCLDAQPSPF